MEYQVDLSKEHLNDIFYYLSLNDIIKCRLVNKLWKRTVDEIKIESLAVIENSTYYNDSTRYFVTNKNVKYSSIVLYTKDMNFFQDKMMKIMLNELKILYVQLGTNGNSTFSLDSNINHLKSLEQLYFGHLDTIKGRSLKLPKLKILQIDSYSKENGLKFQCKELTDFKTGKTLNHFIFTFPKKLTNLNVVTLDHNEKRIETLVSLETLTIENGDSLPDDIIKMLPKLTKLDIKEILKDKLSFLLKQKKVLRRLKLNIFVGHINIQTNGDIEDFYPTDKRPSKKGQLIFKKYKSLEYYLPWADEIDFNELDDFFDSKIPDDIHKRFSDVQTLYVSRPINNIENFKRFVENCKNLKKLEMDAASVDQSIYDGLNDLCENLTHLKVNESKDLDLKFIQNHKKLQSFHTNQELPCNLFFSLNDQLKCLNSLDFKLNGKNTEVILSYHNSYFKIDGDEANFQTRTSMFEFLKIFLLDE